MSDLLKEFVTECRDLVESLSRDILQLEDQPEDRDTLNAVFRSIHTMKGASGLFEIAPFTKVVHAAEEVLDRAREGEITLDSMMIDAVLAVIDQVAQWIEQLDADAALEEDAMVRSLELQSALARFQGAEKSVQAAAAPSLAEPPPVWIAELSPELVNSPVPEGAARYAITYRPDEQACFTGGDPLLAVRQVAGIEWLAIARTRPWAEGPMFDPYLLALEFRIVAVTTASALEAVFRYVLEEVRIDALTAVPAAHAAPADLRTEARALLETQLRLLCGAAPGIERGTMESIARVVAGVCASFERDVPPPVAEIEDGAEVEVANLKLALEALLAEIVAEPVPAEARPASSAAGQGSVSRAGSEGATKAAPPKALRVDQARIDELMNLIGELVVAKNGLPFLAARAETVFGARELGREIKTQFGALNRIAEDLQSSVMQIRMVTLARVFQRFPRLVRDLARKTGKEIRLVMEGEEAEIDKNSVDDLGEPLIHMIRNSVDHGIEKPEQRLAQGKPREGTIRIAARQLDDQVRIEVSDDGAGIDPARVRRKAIEKGLITEERAAAMSERESLELILLPGFSTAEQVSELSGRGVGMDVLRTMVQGLGGHLSIQSTIGVGTTISFSIPLSVAVTRVMMIEVAGQCFGIPMDRILETVRLPKSARHAIERGQAIVLRDRLVPVCPVGELLGFPSAGRDESDDLYLVVKVGADRCALIVDRVHEGIDTIVKPLEGVLAGISLYAGTAILGDGRVMLELDVEELVRCHS